jgi:hypothetical protein
VNLDKLFEVTPDYESEFSSRRIEEKVTTHVIYTKKEGPVENATDPAKYRIARYISPEKFPINADMTIYGNKIALFTYRTKAVYIIIENEDIAELFKGLFKTVWATLPA